MVFSNITKAFIIAFEAGQFGWPIVFENVAYDSTNGDPFIELNNLPAPVIQASLGDQGCDFHSGVIQATLNYPLNKGRTDLDLKADEINQIFYSGKVFQQGGLNVRVDNVSMNLLAAERGFARMALSIEYFAYSKRIGLLWPV